MSNLKFDANANVLTVPEVEGVDYWIDGKIVTGEVTLEKTTDVKATPKKGFRFPKDTETVFTFDVKSGESEPVVKTEDQNKDASAPKPVAVPRESAPTNS